MRVVAGKSGRARGDQWSEEPPPRGFLKLLDNSRLIPIFGVKEQWFQWSIVLECGGQAAFHSDLLSGNQPLTSAKPNLEPPAESANRLMHR
jgi:hypothetical protein